MDDFRALDDKDKNRVELLAEVRSLRAENERLRVEVEHPRYTGKDWQTLAGVAEQVAESSRMLARRAQDDRDALLDALRECKHVLDVWVNAARVHDFDVHTGRHDTQRCRWCAARDRARKLLEVKR